MARSISFRVFGSKGVTVRSRASGAPMLATLLKDILDP
jgi:hypothetical protein